MRNVRIFIFFNVAGSRGYRKRNLAVLLAETMQLDEVEVLYSREMELAPLEYGETHRKTLTLMHNFAAFLESRGRDREAEASFVRILDARMDALGDQHRHTLLTMNSFFHMVSWQRHHGEAIA